MASQGPLSAGTGADDNGVGTITWNNPGNIVSENDVVASAGPGLGGTYVSHYLKATNFGFSIPSGATINGIVVEIRRASDNGAGSEIDNIVKLVKGGTISGNNKASASAWPVNSNYQYATYGSSSDLWGLTFTDSDINASNFGVVISSKSDGSSGNNNPAIDHIRITVYYTSSTNYTITAAQGSYTYTGQTSLLKIGRLIVAVFGSYTLTGQPSLLKIGWKIIAAVGSYTFSGQSVALSVGKTIVAAVGTFVLTGQNAVLNSTRSIVAAVGSFTLSGQNSLFSIGHTLIAGVGSFAYTGINVALYVGKKIVAAYGSFTLTGQNSTFHIARLLTAAYGVMTVSWQTFRLLLNGFLAIYGDKYTKRNTSCSDKYSSRGTSYTDKYTHLQ